jgi:MraZ protein
MENTREISELPLPERLWDFGFTGQYKYTIDAKGRVSVPVPFRKLDDGRELTHFKLTNGLDNCLFLFPYEYWRKEVEPQLKRLPVLDAKARKLFRKFASSAVDCKPDKQGRIMIPSILREKRGLDGEVIIAGGIDRIEIWSLSSWDEYELIDDTETDDIAQEFNINF